jgi:signal transduction histidine kinase
MVGCISDITERKRAEEEKEKLSGQLLHAQKMESVGRLAGGVAHDFNNLLQVILGNVSLSIEFCPLGSPARDLLEEVRRAAERSADLTRQLLAFARKQEIKPRVLDLNAAVADLIKMIGRLIGESIQLAWEPDPTLWLVKMDPGQVGQILTNLCVNARDAIANAGKITIVTSNVTLDAAYALSHPGCVPGDHVLLSVADNGKGMDAFTRAHLFEPFFTTKATGTGTGLGLATVYGIVTQNLGQIDVASEPGQGTTIKIYLQRAEPVEVPAVPNSAGTLLRGSETVLLVEDEEQVLKLGQRMLEQLV